VTIYNDHELLRTFYLLALHSSWSAWEENGDWAEDVTDLGTVKVVQNLKDSRRGLIDYDDMPQGSTAPAGLTFCVTYPDKRVRHFQMQGRYNSYGDREWTGPFIEVEKVTKTVSAYEPIRT